jgi:hypothetical protein
MLHFPPISCTICMYEAPCQFVYVWLQSCISYRTEKERKIQYSLDRQLVALHSSRNLARNKARFHIHHETSFLYHCCCCTWNLKKSVPPPCFIFTYFLISGTWCWDCLNCVNVVSRWMKSDHLLHKFMLGKIRATGTKTENEVMHQPYFIFLKKNTKLS